MEGHSGEHDPEYHLSPVPVLVGLGTLLLYISLEYRGAFLAVGGLAFLVPLALWVREDVRYFREGRVDHGVLPGRDMGWWGMIFFLGTEVMLFGSLFAAFFAARDGQAASFAFARPHLDHALTLVTINTAILVTSGFFAHYGLHAIRKDDRRGFLIGLVGAIVLGAVFLGIQVSEYTTLIAAGVTLDSGAFGSIFYVLTGTHGFHVFVGIVFFLVVLYRAVAKGQFDAKRHVSMDTFTIYWHFVDVVWIGLYLIVYVDVLKYVGV